MPREAIGLMPDGSQAFVGSDDAATGVATATPVGLPAPVGTGVIAPAISPVVTSDQARDSYQAILDSITRMSNTAPAVPIAYGGQTYTDTTALLGAQRDSLAARRQAEIQRLNQEFDAAEKKQGRNQAGEVGTRSMGLARIGGFDSASGQAVLTNLQRVHEEEQQALLGARQSAILQAQNAYDDKDFEFARLQLDEARKAEQLLYDRQKDFVALTLQLKGEQRADLSMQLQQSQFDYQKNRDVVADQRWAMQWASENGITSRFFRVGNTAIDSETGERLTLERYQELTGQPVGAPEDQTDFTQIQTLEGAQEQKFRKEQDRAYVQSLAEKYFDAGVLLTDSPEIAQNKIKKTSRIYAEQIRPPSSGGGGGGSIPTSTQRALASAGATVQALKDSRGQGDQKYDPEVYLKLRQDFAAIGGDVAIFDNIHASGLSAQERANLGIGKAAGTDATPGAGGYGE